jgi:nitrogen regulatory protein P-II 1
LRVEIVCADGLVDQVVEVIQKMAHTGLRGDGKIYVIAVEEAVRISTGARGDMAA